MVDGDIGIEGGQVGALHLGLPWLAARIAVVAAQVECASHAL